MVRQNDGGHLIEVEGARRVAGDLSVWALATSLDLGCRRGTKIKPIVTSTVNPAINGAAEVEQVHPIHKIRSWNERYDPGGGGFREV